MKRTARTLKSLVGKESPVEKVTSIGGKNLAQKAWLAVGGLLALGATVMIIREFPSMRRELRLMSM